MNQPLIRLTEIAAAYDQKKVLEHIYGYSLVI